MKFKHITATSAVFFGRQNVLDNVARWSWHSAACAAEFCVHLFPPWLLLFPLSLSPGSYDRRRQKPLNSLLLNVAANIDVFKNWRLLPRFAEKAPRSAVISILQMKSIMGSGSLIPAARVLAFRIQASSVLFSDSSVNPTLEDWRRGRRDVVFFLHKTRHVGVNFLKKSEFIFIIAARSSRGATRGGTSVVRSIRTAASTRARCHATRVIVFCHRH